MRLRAQGGELDELGATAVLKRAAPAWWWLRKNFTLPAVLTIAGILAASATWLWHQHQAIEDLRRRPDLGPQLAGLAARLDANELERARQREQLKDLAGRTERLEENWDRAGLIASERRRRR